jgi:hypothetical protein
MAEQQKDLKSSANKYLSDWMPNIITVVNGAGAVASLVVSLDSLISTAGPPLPPVGGPLRAIVKDMTKQQSSAGVTEGELVRFVEKDLQCAGRLSATLKRQIKDLEGPNGKIAKIQANILTLQETIGKDLETVVKEARSIGEGVKKILQFTARLIASSRGASSGESGNGAGEGIDDMAQHGTELNKTLTKLREHGEKLAEFHHELAKANTSLAEAVEMHEESNSYVDAVGAVRKRLSVVVDVWQDICTNSHVAVDRLVGDNDFKKIKNELETAVLEWEMVQQRIDKTAKATY